MTIKAILFDKDGTLLDFNATFAPATALVLRGLADGNEALAQVMAERVDFDMATQIIHPGSVLIAGSVEEISASLMPLTGETDLARMNARVDQLYVQHSKETVVPFDFLVPTLDALEGMNMPLGVATNDSQNGALSHLNRIDVSSRFCFIAGYDSGFGEKPGPGMVLAFAEHLDLPASAIAMVGDSAHDCVAGRAAGAMAIGVASGGALAVDLLPHADHVLDDISALPGWLAAHNSGSTP